MCDRWGFSVEHFGMNEAAASKRNKTELSFEEYMAMNAIDNSEPTEKDEDTPLVICPHWNPIRKESYIGIITVDLQTRCIPCIRV